jgi:cell wall-associated NlpC family hydrolase
MALREALARRRAWTEPRQELLEPAKVQDPPAVEEEGKAVTLSSATGAEPVARKEVRIARNTALDKRVNNEDLIREALRNRGVPYVWGGASRGGFDCSGFICYLFLRQRGIKLPHSASAQARIGTPVSCESLQPGDVVFFRTYRPGISHVGLYVGNNQFVHAANKRRDVRIDTLTGYYAKRLKAARRISPAPIRFSPEELQRYMQESSETPGDEKE